MTGVSNVAFVSRLSNQVPPISSPPRLSMKCAQQSPQKKALSSPNSSYLTEALTLGHSSAATWLSLGEDCQKGKHDVDGVVFLEKLLVLQYALHYEALKEMKRREKDKVGYEGMSKFISTRCDEFYQKIKIKCSIHVLELLDSTGLGYRNGKAAAFSIICDIAEPVANSLSFDHHHAIAFTFHILYSILLVAPS